MAPEYADREYWDKRYGEAAGFFDWYHGYDALRELLDAHLSRSCPVLQVGVGTSTLQLDMVLDGYQSITNVDYSAVVIAKMRELHRNVRGLRYAVADCRDMRSEIADESFGTVIDKGTLDAILCGHDAFENAARLLLECSRVLARGGLFVLVTYGGPDYRLPYLEDASLDWDVLVYVLARRTASMSGNRTPAAGRRAGWLPWQADCKGKCWLQEAGANAASAGDESDEGGPGEGSSAGATSYGECTSAEPMSDGSGGSSGHGGCGSDEPQVQVQGPFQPWVDWHRTRLSELSGVRDLHFVYVCRKHTRPQASPAGAAC